MFKQILKRIFGSKYKYQPLVKVLVFKNRLVGNLRLFQDKFPEIRFAPVLKSNAYGHGLVTVGKILDAEKLPFFVVDSFYEAVVLKNSGVKTKILVIGYSMPEHLAGAKPEEVAFTVVSLGHLEELSKNLRKPALIHLKIDTGMHRQGVLPGQFEQAIDLVKANKNLQVEGVCSHLADADGKDPGFTKSQIVLWNSAVEKFKNAFPAIKYWHLSNSAGTAFTQEIKANVVRLGIALYGFDQSGKMPGLKPCLAMKTLVTGVKTIEPGDFVGYNITFRADSKMAVATLPVGYFEGVDRRLSGIGFVKIKDQFSKILGRVSMNLTVIDVTGIQDVRVGDEAVVVSGESEDKNSASLIAKECNTIVYDILVRIPQHLRRETVNG